MLGYEVIEILHLRISEVNILITPNSKVFEKGNTLKSGCGVLKSYNDLCGNFEDTSEFATSEMFCM